MMNTVIKKKYLPTVLLAIGCVVIGYILFPSMKMNAAQNHISVHGAVKKTLDLSLADIQAMPEFHINAVCVLKEKQKISDEEEFVEVANYSGVLLRDVLEKAGMKYVRKFEPAVFIRVKGSRNENVVFSFGEIFYTSIGRSTLLAYRKNGKPIDPSGETPDLIVSNDIRNGRIVSSVREILVERADVEMNVYQERKKHIVQPPTTFFDMDNKSTGKQVRINMETLLSLPEIAVYDKVQVGDCEGFHGAYSYEGISLRSLLEKENFIEHPYRYNQYIAINSKNGFCATYSIGELFNSRLENNIVVAYKKDGQLLGPDEAFAMIVGVEDNTGGRSVKRISNVTLYAVSD